MDVFDSFNETFIRCLYQALRMTPLIALVVWAILIVYCLIDLYRRHK